MHLPQALAKPLTIAVFLSLLSPLQLFAAPACSKVEATTQVEPTQKGQAIDSAEALSAALQRAQGGETLLLAPGNYGSLLLEKTFRSPLTLRSANPLAPACFTALRLKGVDNVTLDGLFFDHVYTAGDRDFTNSFSIQASRRVTISNSIFDGGYLNGAGHARGLLIWDSASIDIRNNVFRKWWEALFGGRGHDLTVYGNEFYDIRSDGMALAAMNGLVIEANRLHNFRGIEGNGDHRDMIQILRSTNERTTNLVIRNNIFDIGTGDFAQTIWMGGDGKDLGDPMLRHQNVLIENNMIYNAHLHGISVYSADNLSIRKNSVIRVRRAEQGDVSVPWINISPDSTSVVIEQNAVAGIRGYENQRDWAVLNNAIIQDTSPSSPGYYDRQFIYYATGGRNGSHQYGIRPGSLIEQLNAGSTLAKSYPIGQ